MKTKKTKVYYLGHLTEEGVLELLGVDNTVTTFPSAKEADSVLTFLMNLSVEFYDFKVYVGTINNVS